VRMDLGVISSRYAKALLKSASQAQVEQQVYSDMRTLATSYLEVPQLRQTVDNPMLNKQTKLNLLATACGLQPAELTRKFLELVLKEDRENALQFMANAYISLYRQQKNIIQGKLTTAVAVSPETENKMRQMVESRTRGNVEFNTEVDPNIIGGFILEYDTYRMDASVKSQLNNLLKQLK
jgi:F-type H+-transporting ATPase subunit delta